MVWFEAHELVWRMRPPDRTVRGVDLRLVTRIALGYLAFVSIQIGAWALLAPRSFYDDFPGFGRAWVSVDGPFNEHLVRDVGALNLALAVVLVAAAIRLTRWSVSTAAAVSLAWGVPHLVYHAVETDGYSTGDLVASLTGLTVFAAIPVALLVVARPRLPGTPATASSEAVAA